MPADPADPFATPASTQQEHDARMALVAELRLAREKQEAIQDFTDAFDHWRETHEGWLTVLDARSALAAYDAAKESPNAS